MSRPTFSGSQSSENRGTMTMPSLEFVTILLAFMANNLNLNLNLIFIGWVGIRIARTMTNSIWVLAIPISVFHSRGRPTPKPPDETHLNGRIHWRRIVLILSLALAMISRAISAKEFGNVKNYKLISRDSSHLLLVNATENNTNVRHKIFERLEREATQLARLKPSHEEIKDDQHSTRFQQKANTKSHETRFNLDFIAKSASGHFVESLRRLIVESNHRALIESLHRLIVISTRKQTNETDTRSAKALISLRLRPQATDNRNDSAQARTTRVSFDQHAADSNTTKDERDNLPDFHLVSEGESHLMMPRGTNLHKSGSHRSPRLYPKTMLTQIRDNELVSLSRISHDSRLKHLLLVVSPTVDCCVSNLQQFRAEMASVCEGESNLYPSKNDNFSTIPHLRNGSQPSNWEELVHNSRDLEIDKNYEITRTWFKALDDPTAAEPADEHRASASIEATAQTRASASIEATAQTQDESDPKVSTSSSKTQDESDPNVSTSSSKTQDESDPNVSTSSSNRANGHILPTAQDQAFSGPKMPTATESTQDESDPNVSTSSSTRASGPHVPTAHPLEAPSGSKAPTASIYLPVALMCPHAKSSFQPQLNSSTDGFDKSKLPQFCGRTRIAFVCEGEYNNGGTEIASTFVKLDSPSISEGDGRLIPMDAIARNLQESHTRKSKRRERDLLCSFLVSVATCGETNCPTISFIGYSSESRCAGATAITATKSATKSISKSNTRWNFSATSDLQFAQAYTICTSAAPCKIRAHHRILWDVSHMAISSGSPLHRSNTSYEPSFNDSSTKSIQFCGWSVQVMDVHLHLALLMPLRTSDIILATSFVLLPSFYVNYGVHTNISTVYEALSVISWEDSHHDTASSLVALERLHANEGTLIKITHFHEASIKISFRASHADTIGATSFVRIPRRSHVNEGEACSSSMLRDDTSFVYSRLNYCHSNKWNFISGFVFGLFISVILFDFGHFFRTYHFLQHLHFTRECEDKLDSDNLDFTPTVYLFLLKFRYSFIPEISLRIDHNLVL